MPAAQVVRNDVRRTAEAVLRLFERGRIDPSAAEIAREYYGDQIVISEGEVRAVQHRLLRIVRLFEQEQSFHVYALSSYYYEDLPGKRPKQPETEDQARRCLLLGRGVRAVGLHKVVDPKDPIWRACIDQQGKSSAGSVKKLVTQVRGLQEDELEEHQRRFLARSGIPHAVLADRALPEPPGLD